MKMQPCTKAPKHKWVWVRDRTVKSGSFGPSGARMSISRKGVYACECGEAKYGEAKSGIPVAEAAP